MISPNPPTRQPLARPRPENEMSPAFAAGSLFIVSGVLVAVGSVLLGITLDWVAGLLTGALGLVAGLALAMLGLFAALSYDKGQPKHFNAVILLGILVALGGGGLLLGRVLGAGAGLLVLGLGSLLAGLGYARNV